MERTPIQSGNLATVGYDESQGALEVEFTGGDVYRYAGVPKAMVDEMLAADSPSAYFHERVLNAYPFQRLGGREGDLENRPHHS